MKETAALLEAEGRRKKLELLYIEQRDKESEVSRADTSERVTTPSPLPALICRALFRLRLRFLLSFSLVSLSAVRRESRDRL